MRGTRTKALRRKAIAEGTFNAERVPATPFLGGMYGRNYRRGNRAMKGYKPQQLWRRNVGMARSFRQAGDSRPTSDLISVMATQPIPHKVKANRRMHRRMRRATRQAMR